MPDYSKGKIYRLTCNDPDLIYYGSTVQTLKKRISHHKSHLNCSSKKLFDVGGVEIELVLECPCDNEIELREIEDTYIVNDKCVNITRPFVSQEEQKLNRLNYDRTEPRKEKKKEYQEKNLLEKAIYDIEYRIKNSDKINKDIDCECGGIYKLKHKSTHFKTKIHMRYAKDK